MSADTPARIADVVETDVNVTTPDGVCDAALFHPAGERRWPGVLMWPDAIALRPELRTMGRRLAAEGYVVLIPNQYYRSDTASAITADGRGRDREKRDLMRTLITPDGLQDDARALIAFLRAQPQTADGRMGVHGYCMGGSFAFRTADAEPARIGAVGSFHGGALVGDGPKSPHHAIGRVDAQWLICIAQDDDVKKPEAKDVLKAALAQSGRSGSVEVYAADHGWCVLGHAKYDEGEAERAWAELLQLYRTAL